MNLLAWGVAKSVVPNIKGDHFSHINLGSGDGRRKWEEKVEATLIENIFPPKGTYSNLSNWTGWILPRKPSSPQISMSFNKGIRLMTRLDPVGSIPLLIFFFLRVSPPSPFFLPIFPLHHLSAILLADGPPLTLLSSKEHRRTKLRESEREVFGRLQFFLRW